ncbi:MAG: hypothetical protein K0U86_17640 [Planctomycetes bacterium]|nr:hypothetical protein [Planctomycetota bacterium]MCH9726729.1 hypothetical protein [Planctomycetota bacterium]MCH9779637.1 hypothetical protein [Planctomycetota bacterium]MCH9792195.1 hypothetical protein [Planctomycetota bacterium]
MLNIEFMPPRINSIGRQFSGFDLLSQNESLGVASLMKALLDIGHANHDDQDGESGQQNELGYCHHDTV